MHSSSDSSSTSELLRRPPGSVEGARALRRLGVFRPLLGARGLRFQSPLPLRWLGRFGVLLGVLPLALSAMATATSAPSPDDPGAPSQEVPRAEAETWEPHAHPAPVTRRWTAYTAPRRTVEISAEVTARVLSVAVSEGDVVAAPSGEGSNGESPRDRTHEGSGDFAPVVQLDASWVAAKELASAAAARSSRASIALERAALASARRDLDYHSDRCERFEKLFAEGRVTELELNGVRRERDLAQLDVARVEAALALAEARTAEAESNLAIVREELARHRILAPVGWRVERRRAEPGHLARPGEPLLTLIDPRSVRVRLFVSESELAALAALDRIELTSARTGRTRTARLEFVASQVDPETRKQEIWLEVGGGEDGRLTPFAGGAEVLLELSMGSRASGLLIPSRFVTRLREEWRVQDEAGQWHPLRVLRKEGDAFVVPESSLPSGVRIVKPERER